MKVGMQKSWLSVIDEWDQIDLISPVFSCLLGPRADPNHRQILQLSPITIHYFDWRTVFVDAKVAFIILNPEFCCWKIPTFADSRLWSIRVGFNCCEGIPHEGHGSTGRLGNRRHSQAAGHLKPRHIWHFHGSLINFHGIWCCEICWSIYFFNRSNGDLKRKGWANDAWIRARALTKSLWTMSGCNAAAVQRLFGPPSPSRPVENWWKIHSWNPNMTRCKPLLSGKSM